MEFNELYKERRSNRFYLDKEVKETDISLLLDAGMHAPVARGRYEDIKLYCLKGERIKDLMNEIKKVSGIDPSFKAPLLILVVHRGKNIDLINQDCGCILENICLEAANLGLGSVYSYTVARLIKSSDYLKEYLKIDGNSQVLAGAFIGYKSSDVVSDAVHKIEVVY